MAKAKLGKAEYLDWFKSMMLQRRFEEKTGQLYTMQKIRGFCHLYIGQEAVSTGIVAATEKEDIIITAYRDHGFALARGMHPNAAMAEMYGKATGCTKGKGGSMHFFDVDNYFYGGHAIVGAQIPMGAGIAFAEGYKNTGRATVCLFGDGAVRQGALHETFTMAKLWNVPCVFVIENNGYAMGTSVSRSGPEVDMYKLGEGYGMPSWSVNGMDVTEMHNEMSKALEICKKGEGPVLLEVRTYRYKGHSMSDPQKYRTKEEVEQYKAKDPIEQVRELILSKKWAKAEELEEMEEEIVELVAGSVQFAEDSPFPDESELYKDIYVQEDYPFIKE